MNTTAKTLVPLVELRTQLEARHREFASALPSHIKPEYFQRATLTAIQQNPKLLDADRRSLLNALMRCASDGLLPDGRQAAMVIYGSNVQYQQMIAGVRKLVQQSGEVTRFDQIVVRENDQYDELYGTETYIKHRPALTNRGEPILIFSIAQFKDGTLSYERMTVEEIEKVRAVSRAKNAGPWVDWWEEMAKKTIAKRHAKVLPMSNDAAAALARDDAEHSELPAAAPVSALQPQNRPRSLSAKLDALGTASDDEPKRPRRGRPRQDDEPTDEEIAQSQARLDALLGDEEPPLTGDEPELQTEKPDDGWPGPAGAVRHDYEQGKRDAVAGRTDCLNREIRDIATRYAEWRKGYDSVKKNR